MNEWVKAINETNEKLPGRNKYYGVQKRPHCYFKVECQEMTQEVFKLRYIIKGDQLPKVISKEA